MKVFIRILVVVVLLSDVVFMQTEKDRAKVYRPLSKAPADQPWPGIENYPRALQEYDSIRIEYIKWGRQTYNKVNKTNPEIPDNLFLPLARAMISARLYHYSLNRDGAYNRYRNGRGGAALVSEKLREMPEPWKTISRISGIVMVEVIKDTLLRRDNCPFHGYPEDLVSYCKVVDDLLSSIPEDTIMVRHTTDWFKKNLKISDHSKISLAIKSGVSAVLNDEVIYILVR